MDDYMTKPIDPDILFAALRKRIKLKKGAPATRESVAAPCDLLPEGRKGKSDPRLLTSSQEAIDVEEFLRRLGGNEKLLLKILEDFCGIHGNTVDGIKSAVDSGDTEQAFKLVHGLKGTAGNISAKELELAASELEMGIMKKGDEKIAALVDHLDEALKQVLRSKETLNRIMENRRS
jgi:HPt (histidine-containing phosphotransfer) domain-containing protein